MTPRSGAAPARLAAAPISSPEAPGPRRAFCFDPSRVALPLQAAGPAAARQARRRRSRPGDGWAYEPKWDGFRAIAFVDGDEVDLQSRNGEPLRRYFPELAFPAGALRARRRDRDPRRRGRSQDFDALGQRIHPAESRVDMLAERDARRASSPSTCSRTTTTSLLELPAGASAATGSEALVAGARRPHAGQRATPPRPSRGCSGAEGVIAKQPDAPYRPGERVGHGEDQARAHDRRGRAAAGGRARRRARSAR